MKISKRLRAISDFISDNSFILDIGCDHALLDIYVVLNKKNVKAIASDVRKEPLKKAKENIEKYNVKDKVTPVLGDGLDSYRNGVDTIVMSGLGSTTIVDILKNGVDSLNKINRLIVSSNNDYYFLRKSICNLGFYVKNETIVNDKGKYYPVIIFERGRKKYSYFELKYGPVLLKNKSAVFINYLIFNKGKLEVIYRSLMDKHLIKKIKIKSEIKYLNSIINNKLK